MKKKFSISTLTPIPSFLILFCAFFIVIHGTLVTPQNISDIVNQAFPIIISGTGMLFVIAMDNTDLSAGTNAALSATLDAVAASHLGTQTIFPVAIGTGMLVGTLNGPQNSRCKIPSFMTILVMLVGLRGLLNYFLTSSLIYTPTVLITFNTFPVELTIMTVLVIIFYYVLKYIKTGHYCRAIGENEHTVTATGINVKRIRMTTFIISGFMAALFDIMQIINVGGSTNSLCRFMEMRIQVAIFLGGVSVTGGFNARIYRLLIGSFTIVMIENGLALCGVDSTLSGIIQDILLILVLFATIYFERRSVANRIHRAVNATNAWGFEHRQKANRRKQAVKGITADYVKLPELEEYREWSKDHLDLCQEDGILQITTEASDRPMYWNGTSHRTISQLGHIISLGRKSEILIWTRRGDNWMTDKDPHGWSTYAKEHPDHQCINDTSLIKNMVSDIDVPTVGAIPGPGFHWDSALLCDITLAPEGAGFSGDHLFFGLMAGDDMFMLTQHFLGTKRANYLMYTCHQWTVQQALDWGQVDKLVPKGKVIDRAWEIARMLKTPPRETRTIQSQLYKRPLECLLINDLKLHMVSRQYSTTTRTAARDYGEKQTGGRDMSMAHRYRYATNEYNELLQSPIRSWDEVRKDMVAWGGHTGYQDPSKVYGE